jgi:hypothetical protein
MKSTTILVEPADKLLDKKDDPSSVQTVKALILIVLRNTREQ